MGDPIYENYHDTEWGVPVFDEQKIFEFLTLETFQAGLSWITVLKKRTHFSDAFDQFDYHKIAEYDSKKIEDLKVNTGIIRNRLKIEAAVNNAQAFVKIQEKYGSFSNFIWDFVNGKPIINSFKSVNEIPPFTPLAQKISFTLKKKALNLLVQRYYTPICRQQDWSMTI